MGDAADHQRLAADVLGIRGAPPELARRLVAQALVIEDRQDAWHRDGERICRDAPDLPASTSSGRGRTRVVRRQSRQSAPAAARALCRRRWRALEAGMSRVADAEWTTSDRSSKRCCAKPSLIDELQPIVNVQIGAPELYDPRFPHALFATSSSSCRRSRTIRRRSSPPASTARAMIQRTRRNGADLAVHAARLASFFGSPNLPFAICHRRCRDLSPLVFSWLAGRGANASRLDPHDSPSARAWRVGSAALLRDERLFHERLEQR